VTVDLADAVFSTPALRATFSGEALVARMLAFEAALARAEARAGIIPAGAGAAIAAACSLERIDVTAVLRDTAAAGTPAIPLMKQLTAAVGGEAARYVHWGATSQDAVDTATVLQAREGLDAIERGLLALADACAQLARAHRATVMPGRTLLQQALPMTFGLKAARWLAMVVRQVEAVRALRGRVLVVQLGGAAGTLASLGADGASVVDLLADELELAAPGLPWHAERDRVGELAAALGVIAGAVGKIALDVALLAQTEVGEAAEGAAPGKGGSSTLPQKRNPVDAVEAIAASRLAIGLVPVVLSAMLQEHERAIGGWQAEWAAVPELFERSAAAVERAASAVAALEIYPARMAANLEQAGGLLMAESLSTALAASLGRVPALALVQELSRRAATLSGGLREAALADERVRAALSPDQINRALDPRSYLGSADLFVDRALADHARLSAG
jgi:3-carboxy-cis,cis-muconate cycloisomerase